MSKAKKISFNMIAAEMNDDTKHEVIHYNGKNNNYEIDVKQALDFEDAMHFVMDIVSSCSDEKTAYFSPEGFDFAVRVNALIYYAGFVVPSDISKAYHVVYQTTLFYDIMEIIDQTQFGTLVKAAKDKVAFIRETIIATQSSKINALVDKMDEVMRDGNDVVAALNSNELRSRIDDIMQIVGTMQTTDNVGQDVGNDSSDNIVALPGNGEQ